MGGDNLDARLEPVAELLLIVIVMIMVAAVASYVLMKIAQRRKEKAHNKLSASRRAKDSAINLLAKGSEGEAVPVERGRTERRKPRKRSSFDFLGFLKQVAERLERPKRSRRGKRRRRRRSSSDNLRLDILKKPEAAFDPHQEPPTP